MPGVVEREQAMQSGPTPGQVRGRITFPHKRRGATASLAGPLLAIGPPASQECFGIGTDPLRKLPEPGPVGDDAGRDLLRESGQEEQVPVHHVNSDHL